MVHHRGKSGQELEQGRNLEAETKAEAFGESCLLACSARFLRTLEPQLKGGTAHVSQSSLHINHPSRNPTGLPASQSGGGILSDDSSLCQVDMKLASTTSMAQETKAKVTRPL